jgi:cytochrome b
MARQSNPYKDGRPILVWDLPTRLFHWLLVASVTFALLTGFLAPKWWVGRHIWAGYAIGALLIFRAIWAAHGSHYSRLGSFLYSPRQAIQHLRAMQRGRPPHFLGHNPAGAMMIFALIAILFLIVATGMLVQGGSIKQGPFAGFVSFALGENLRGLHQLLAFLLLGLIAAHLAGVLAGSWLFKERLVGAMIDGEKPVVSAEDALPHAASRPVAAILWLGAVGGGFALALVSLSRVPALGLPAMPADPVMVEECGACHHSFHPSLLPRASWAAMMADLGNHFGDDATLSAAKRDEIAAYLERYAAEAWDTNAARRFLAVSADQPQRITATPGWLRLHRRLDPSIFHRPTVKAKSNCIGCHLDADSGRFDPQAISLPP